MYIFFLSYILLECMVGLLISLTFAIIAIGVTIYDKSYNFFKDRLEIRNDEEKYY